MAATGDKTWSASPFCYMHMAASLGLRYWLVPHANINGEGTFAADIGAVVRALAALDLTH
jgi:hypothetical protein